jgi:RNA polymerase sigma-70 factor, ECF subfamily
MLEKAILGSPEEYRLVLMLRDVKKLSTDETAECLSLSQENVRVRLHRARAILRKELYARAGATTARSFEFHAAVTGWLRTFLEFRYARNATIP